MSIPIFYSFPSNARYGIFLSDTDFTWKPSVPEDAICPPPDNIVKVLDSVKIAFENYFDKDHVNNFQVSILPHDGAPITYRKQHIVFLSARGLCWSQYMYQFAHELCHVMIDSAVITHFCWFEESVCELASLFFLNIISNMWNTNPPYPNWQPYASAIHSYVMDRINESIKIPSENNFKQYFEERETYLANECGDRKINLLCATNLLPIFERYPDLWNDIPKISELKDSDSFKDTLLSWKNLSHQKTAIEEIIRLFTVT